MNGLRHDEIEELLGAYALDAVDADEAETVELHLRECARCRSEVEEHRAVAALLAHSGSAAPDEVWERIAGSIDGAPPASVPTLVPGHQRRPRTARWLSGALAAAAAVVALLGFQVARLDDRIEEIRSATTSERGLDLALKSALLDPASTRVQLASTAGGPGAAAVLLPDGRGYLVMDDVEAVADDRTYQLWGITANEVVSLGVLGSEPGTVAFSAAVPLKTLAVTVERAGGVVRSVNTPVLAGDVSRSA